MHQKQVDKDHYQFDRYLGKKRWASIWHQLDETLSLEPDRVLEIGPGPGVFKSVASFFGITVETLDLDPDLEPDHLASAEQMPFADNSYDVVCAFQMLEHLPFEESMAVFSEMARVTRGKIVISLPDARRVWRYLFFIPWLDEVQFLVPRPGLCPGKNKFDGKHYWELNKSGYELNRVIDAFARAGQARLEKTYRVNEFTYHRFLVFSV